MANPQIEEGHIDIANEIADKFCGYRISGEEWQVLWVILRKTYGWHKKTDYISFSQFSEMTGLTRQHSLRALQKLEGKNIIAVTKKGNSLMNYYSLIKNFEKWNLLPKKVTVLPKKVEGVTKNGFQVLPKKGHTKENIQKKLTKENYTSEFLLFWELYPNKKEKAEAFKRWNKLNNSRPTIEIILTAIKKQINWRDTAQDGEFRPEWKHPATWLNKGCWDDELEETEGSIAKFYRIKQAELEGKNGIS